MPAPAGKLAKTSAFPRAVERWRGIVRSELERGNYPWPAELILALIHTESAGVAGAVNQASGASGLMQVMPIVVKGFNRKYGTNLTMDTMRAKTPEAVRLQIRIGLNALANFWRNAYVELGRRAEIPVSDLARIADLWYVAGGRYAKRALRRSPAPTWTAIAAANPGRAVTHAETVWERTHRAVPIWDYAAIDAFLGKKYRPARSGFLAGLILIGLASRFLPKTERTIK